MAFLGAVEARPFAALPAVPVGLAEQKRMANRRHISIRPAAAAAASAAAVVPHMLPVPPPAGGRMGTAVWCSRPDSCRAAKLCCRAGLNGEGAGGPECDPRTEQRGQPGAEPLPPQQAEQLDSNVWAYKPAWCQPYSILATGTAVVAGVWAVSGGSAGWMAAAALPVAAWWYLFLVVYPAQFADYVEGLKAAQVAQRAQRRQQQQQQLEDQPRQG